MPRPLRVLLLEDSAADADLVKNELDQLGMTVLTQRVDSERAFTQALREFAPHVVLSDHALTPFNAAAALEVLHAERPTVPLIVVTGYLDGHTAVECIRAGAEDIVLKNKLHRLSFAIEAALVVRRPLEKLSPRQVEVLRLVAEGKSTRMIASWLGLSIKTVETHRGEVMKRLGIHDVVGLVRYAVRVGLAPSAP